MPSVDSAIIGYPLTLAKHLFFQNEGIKKLKLSNY